MKFTALISIASAALLLSACVDNKVGTVEALYGAPATGGTVFTQHLTKDYTWLVKRLEDAKKYTTSSAALHFSRKGVAASEGTVVVPEALSDWDLTQKDMEEMGPLRDDLIDVLDRGARDQLPPTASVAQVNFDCWVAEQEIDRGVNETDLKDKGQCKANFMKALAQLKAALPAVPKEEFPAPVTATLSGDQGSLKDLNFIVFFDWDHFDLSKSADDTLTAALQKIKGRSDIKAITITGFTDTSGSEQYNDTLSLERAHSVQDYFTAQGIPADKLRVGGRGEHELMIKTPDGVREPQNRRATITFE